MSWMHYNPQRADPKLLDTITSGEARLALRDALLDVIRSESQRTSHQHQLLIGARGAGKTHILRVVAYRVAADPDLARGWWPVVLPEEQGIRGPSELFGALATRLADDLERTDLAAARATATEVKQWIGKARGEEAMSLDLEALRKIASALDRKIIAVVENLDALFYRGVGGGKKEADSAQWGLRKHLQDADFLLLLGAAPTYFGAASDQGAAFHGFFREHSLDALPLEEVIDIARQHLDLVAANGTSTRSQRASDLLARFEKNRGRLAGMLRVTGGLPRFAHLIVDLLIDSEDADAETQLERLLDEQTPYFQGRLDPRLIPPGELEALATLARALGPLRPSELARRASISTGEASVLLERLRERGLARRSGSFGGATAWDVAEPLYRIWMAFREGGEQRNVMRALTEVVAALYSADELRANAELEEQSSDNLTFWELAAAHQPLLDEEPSTPALEEAHFQAAQEALSAAEANGSVPPAVLIEWVNAAWRTGRRALGEARVEAMLTLSEETKETHADALLTAARYGGPDSAARAAAAAALFEELGDVHQMTLARGIHAHALWVTGNSKDAATILDATYQTGVARGLEQELLAWLALQASKTAVQQTEKEKWLDRAESHAVPGSLGHANVWRARAHLSSSPGEALELLERAASVYQSLGLWDNLGDCFLAKCDALAGTHQVERAGQSLAKALDLFLEQDAELDLQVWWRLHDFAVWGPRAAAILALHGLAACVNHDTLRGIAEPWLVQVATQLLAEKSRSHDEVMELIEIARDDLTRERRGILEPFSLAVRMESEPHDAVLFEQSEPMRAVVEDVRRRVQQAREMPFRKRPNWASSAPPVDMPEPSGIV